MASAAPKFQMGDLVWAKMKGFSPWPGKLVDPTNTNMKKPPGNIRNKSIQCVYFFGSNNFAWIPEDAIKPYLEYKEQNLKGKQSNAFKEAVARIEEYIKNGGDDLLDAQLNQAGADGAGSEPNLPSVDEEISQIFENDKPAAGVKKEEKAAAAATAAAGQKDYSRKPFTSKAKKAATNNNAAAATNNNNNNHADDSDSAPPPKRARASTENDEAAKSGDAKSSTNKAGARNILARTSQYLQDSDSTPNATNDLDVSNVSAKAKSIRPSSLKFGFIGLGLMGQRLLKNLLNSGHTVTIWNRTPSKCKDFIKAGASKAVTPADVIAASDITFSCVSDPHAVKELVFGNCGVLGEIRTGKSYIEMTTIDPVTSNDISEAIMARGGRYLEAPLIGSGKKQAEEGNMTVVVAGDKSLFDDCNSCFQAISKHAFYLGSQVGDASKMGLVTSMLMGNMIASLAESMALADRTGLSQKDLLEVLSLSPLNCSLLLDKGRAMIEGGFPTETPLTHQQKDLRLGLALAETYEHPLPITASTNEVFKHAKHLGYTEHDVAAVYIRSRF